MCCSCPEVAALLLPSISQIGAMLMRIRWGFANPCWPMVLGLLIHQTLWYKSEFCLSSTPLDSFCFVNSLNTFPTDFLFQFCDCFSFPYLWLSISFSHCSVANLLTPSFSLPSLPSLSAWYELCIFHLGQTVSFQLWEIWNIKTNISLLHSQ